MLAAPTPLPQRILPVWLGSIVPSAWLVAERGAVGVAEGHGEVLAGGRIGIGDQVNRDRAGGVARQDHQPARDGRVVGARDGGAIGGGVVRQDGPLHAAGQGDLERDGIDAVADVREGQDGGVPPSTMVTVVVCRVPRAAPPAGLLRVRLNVAPVVAPGRMSTMMYLVVSFRPKVSVPEAET